MALKFIMVKDKTGYDISDIVRKCTWSGRKNSAARSLQLELLDDPDLGEENRAGIDVYEGNHLIFLEDDAELFRGIIMTQQRNHERKLVVTAYDSAIYLVNNRDAFVYNRKSLTEIFLAVCKKYGITRGECAPVKYKIPEIAETNTTIYDVLCQAMSKTYYATGERYFIMVKNGQLNLVRRNEQVTKLVLETGSVDSEYGNLIEYNYSKSIANTKTRLKLVSENGEATAKWRDAELEAKLGVMHDLQEPGNDIPAKKLKTQVVTMLNELKRPQEAISVNAVGDSSIYTGIAVYIYIPELGIERTFYVDADTHTWEGDFHTMRLTLNFATDIEQIDEAGNVEKSKKKEKSARKEAKEEIKNASETLKEKKEAEKVVIQCGKKAEKAANLATAALNAIKKAIKGYEKAKQEKTREKHLETMETQLEIAQKQAEKAQAQYEKSKEALVDAKAVVTNKRFKDISGKADFATWQAESNARRAAEAAEEAAALTDPYI